MSKSKIKTPLILVTGVTLIAILFGYLSSSDTPNTEAPQTSTNSSTKPPTQATANNPPPIKAQSQEDKTQTTSPDTISPEEDEVSSALINQVMGQFQSMEEVLENLDHPSVQAMIEAMPKASQKTIQMAALKQSVSKRLDLIETNPHSPIDLSSLNKDIDTLTENFVMMPGEARNLKAYLQQRTKI